MKKIRLTQNKFALVDSSDFIALSKYKWYLSSHGYAATNIVDGSKRTIILMHHMLLPVKKGFVTDHVNLDKLDNRRLNLRRCFRYQNNCNRPQDCRNKVGYKGVWFHKAARKWTAQITIKGVRKHLGLFNSAEEAALAYNTASLEIHGDFAFQNIVRS